MKRLLTLFLLLTSLAGSQASDTLTFSMKKGVLHLGKDLDFFTDPAGSMTPADLSKAVFKPYPQENINLGWSALSAWFRFNLKNEDVTEGMILNVGYALLDEVEIWVKTPDSLYHRLTGDMFPFSSRDMSSPYFAFRLPIRPGQTAEVYLKVKTLSSMQIPLTVYTETEYLKSAQISNFWFGIYYGFLIVMILYNLFIYSTLKDIRYIYYSASIFFSLMFFSVLHGHAQYWLFQNTTSWNQISVHVAMGLLTSTSAIFALSFLNLKKYAPRYRWLVTGVAAAGCFGALSTSFLPVYFLTRFSTFIIMIDALVLTGAGFVAWQAGNKYARLFVAAWICYLLGALLLIGRNMGLLPANMVTSNFANIGSAMEVVLLSLALADKVRILRHEKEEADNQVMLMQRELNQQLESTVASRTAQLQAERDKSEQLLLNILPRPVADELKEKGRASANHHEAVTVIFSDFVNFTRIAENLTPEVLVYQLDCCFRIFDEITASLGLEKIKTIGDAYLCAAGIPQAREDHAEIAIQAAMQMISGIRKFNEENAPQNLPEFVIRIGMHSGPLVSGVVGTRKFAYDIWGDTVNIAARMEQNSEPGRINVSQSTYELLKDRYPFISRGMIQAKNKGSIQMYFLDQEH